MDAVTTAANGATSADDALVRRARTGDAAAFEVLVDSPDRSLLPPRLVDPVQRRRRSRCDPGRARVRLATAASPPGSRDVRRLAQPDRRERRVDGAPASCPTPRGVGRVRPTRATKPHSPNRRRTSQRPNRDGRVRRQRRDRPGLRPAATEGPDDPRPPPRRGATGRRDRPVARDPRRDRQVAIARCPDARSRRRWRPRHERPTLDRRPDLPGPPRPPARGGCPRPARACLRRGGDHRPVAGVPLVPRGPQRSGPGQPPTEPAHRRSAAARAGGRECRGGRGVAPLPAGPDRQVEPGAAGRRPGVRPLELRAAAPAAAGRPDLARQRLGQGPHLRRSVGRGPIRPVRVRRCDGALQLQDPQPRPPHQRGGDRRVRGGLGRTRARGDRRGPAGVPPNRPQCRRTGPGCEMERDPSEVGNGTAAAGWRYVGLEYVAGRPTHHVACGGGDLWIDIETRLILRTQGPAVDDAGQPIPVESTEVTEIAFGEQPAALFEPPEGVARMSADEYSAYICARDLPNELVPGISDCPRLRRRRRRRRPSPRPLRCPPRLQTRASARFRRETRASRSVHWPGPRRV